MSTSQEVTCFACLQPVSFASTTPFAKSAFEKGGHVYHRSCAWMSKHRQDTMGSLAQQALPQVSGQASPQPLSSLRVSEICDTASSADPEIDDGAQVVMASLVERVSKTELSLQYILSQIKDPTLQDQISAFFSSEQTDSRLSTIRSRCQSLLSMLTVVNQDVEESYLETDDHRKVIKGLVDLNELLSPETPPFLREFLRYTTLEFKCSIYHFKCRKTGGIYVDKTCLRVISYQARRAWENLPRNQALLHCPGCDKPFTPLIDFESPEPLPPPPIYSLKHTLSQISEDSLRQAISTFFDSEPADRRLASIRNRFLSLLKKLEVVMDGEEQYLEPMDARVFAEIASLNDLLKDHGPAFLREFLRYTTLEFICSAYDTKCRNLGGICVDASCKRVLSYEFIRDCQNHPGKAQMRFHCALCEHPLVPLFNFESPEPLPPPEVAEGYRGEPLLEQPLIGPEVTRWARVLDDPHYFQDLFFTGIWLDRMNQWQNISEEPFLSMFIDQLTNFIMRDESLKKLDTLLSYSFPGNRSFIKRILHKCLNRASVSGLNDFLITILSRHEIDGQEVRSALINACKTYYKAKHSEAHDRPRSVDDYPEIIRILAGNRHMDFATLTEAIQILTPSSKAKRIWSKIAGEDDLIQFLRLRISTLNP